jgi:hypothetical protein
MSALNSDIAVRRPRDTDGAEGVRQQLQRSRATLPNFGGSGRPVSRCPLWVRQIDGFLDLSWVHKELAPYYSHTGRPPPVRFWGRVRRSLWPLHQVEWRCKVRLKERDALPNPRHDHRPFPNHRVCAISTNLAFHKQSCARKSHALSRIFRCSRTGNGSLAST